MADVPQPPKKPNPPPPGTPPKGAAPPLANRSGAQPAAARPRTAPPAAGKTPPAPPAAPKPAPVKPPLAKAAPPAGAAKAPAAAPPPAKAPTAKAPPKAAPGAVRAVKQPAPPQDEDSGDEEVALPMGKLVAPPAPKPPAPKPPAPPDDDGLSLDFESFASPAAPTRGGGAARAAAAAHSPVLRGKRKDSSQVMLIGIGIGAVVVAGLVAVLLLRGNGEKKGEKTADANHPAKAAEKAPETDKPVDGGGDEKEKTPEKAADKEKSSAEKSSADKPNSDKPNSDKPATDKPATDKPAEKPMGDKAAPNGAGENKTPKKPDDPAAAGKTPGEKNPTAGTAGDKKPTRPNRRPSKKPVATEEMPVSQQYRGIDEVAKADAPEALTKFVTESAEALKKGEFDKFFENDVDPRDRGAMPAAPAKWSPDDLPYDVLAQGKERVTAMFGMLAKQQPRMFEEGKIAVYDLSPRTKPTFVLHDGRWYLSRGMATAMEKRFRTLTDQEQLAYLLETATGAKASPSTDAMFTGKKKEIADKLGQQGVIVAFINTDEQRKGCAVRLTRQFNSGDSGLYTLPQLHDVSPIVVLIIDEISDTGGTDEETQLTEDGLQALSSLKSVEYLHYNGMPTVNSSVLVHFSQMPNLRRVWINGGTLDDGEAITSQLDTTTDMNEFTLRLDQPTNSILNAFKKYPTLKSLTLESRRKTAVTDEAVASLREAMPGLWVDY